MAKRGYNRDTIRGGPSEWDASRPFSSYVRLLSTLLVHPARFFEVLPRIPDVRAPAMFVAFSGLPAAVLWSIFGGWLAALLALLLPLPVSFALAGLYHMGSLGGRFGYPVSWRSLAYPFGFFAPLSAIPILRWVAAAYFGVFIMSVGLVKVREISVARAVAVALVITALLVGAAFALVRL